MSEKKITMHANMESLEPEAKKQFDECCAHDFVTEASLMPDAHTGYVAPIGSVIKTKGAIVPAWVGYDIGCGMIAVKISDDEFHQDYIKVKSKELFEEVNRTIPMGAGRHNDETEFSSIPEMSWMYEDLDILLENTKNMELFDKMTLLSQKNLGTLGSGNHFIEILEHKEETWLVIHSGSRGVGHYIGTYFMKAVSGLGKGFEETYAITDNFAPLKKNIWHIITIAYVSRRLTGCRWLRRLRMHFLKYVLFDTIHAIIYGATRITTTA